MSRRTAELRALRQLLHVVATLIDNGTDLGEAVTDAVASCRVLGPRSYVLKSGIGADGGRGGCVDFGLSIPRNLGNGQIQNTTSNPSISTNSISTKLSRPTWLSPFGAAWVARFGDGSVPPWGPMARALAPLVKGHGEGETLRRWTNFLQGSEARFVSPSRFATTFGSWTTPDPDAWKRDETMIRPGESVDAHLMRLARAGY